MFALVAYGNSDSEEEKDSLNNHDNNKDEDTNENVGAVEIVAKSNPEINGSPDIFETLPKPQINSVGSIVEDDDEFLKKKETPIEKPKKQIIKISIPSVEEFNSDDEETPAKKPKLNNKSCGLFSLLPPPKITSLTPKHFIPNVVKKNINKNVKKLDKSAVSNKDKNIADNMDSDEDDDMKNLPDTFDDEMWQKVCGRKERRVPKPIIEEPPAENTPIIQSDPDVQKPYDGLDNEAFKELIGASSKRKGDVIDIVEINEDEILADKNIWMTKSLTDPEMAPKYVVKDPVNDTCRRKHHITYLAQQAKANEQELQNQWAASRYTRQKTQAKYGF